jgi:hypothetical protein
MVSKKQYHQYGDKSIEKSRCPLWPLSLILFRPKTNKFSECGLLCIYIGEEPNALPKKNPQDAEDSSSYCNIIGNIRWIR